MEPFKFVPLELGIEGPSSIRRRVHFWPPCLELGRRARTEAGSMACRRGCMTGRQAQTMPMLHSTLIQMARWVIVPGSHVSCSGQSHIIIATTPVLTCQVGLLEFFDEKGSENACNTCADITGNVRKKTNKNPRIMWRTDMRLTYKAPMINVPTRASFLVKSMWRPASHGIGNTSTTISVKVLMAPRQ